ncbi:NAD-glutamate dehydrogenase [Acidiphilium iwatense]|uniref:NAD-glutamate dehydrogenase n=1 Tax=Acidiphilium iwatense TaxID=768198 RepID=A0ABS9DV73_9PROT|nr:NAD-glutamate dehydrogenase domain-containing protein [Acidiphilium iwatense]MCF3946599.1 NAD-glutamate dehydrogenase [Acidiphilium iwatense]
MTIKTQADRIQGDSEIGGQRPGRDALIGQIAGAIRRSLQGSAGDAACRFLLQYTAGMATTDLATRSVEDIAAASLSLWSFAQERKPGTNSLRVFNPRGSGAGWGNANAVLELINDDKPFLVESALAVLQSFEQPVHALIHPVLPVTRDGAGLLQAIGTGKPESMIQIAFGPEADAARIDAIAGSLRLAMADLSAAVADTEPMRTALHATIETMPEGSERDFLNWIGQDNFILLGIRDVRMGPDLSILSPEAASRAGVAPSLGVLRDHANIVFDVLRDAETWRVIAHEALGRFDHIAVAKADSRSRVHRAQLYDVVVVKRHSAEGAPIGLTLFAGLFVADSYNRNPRSIPMLRDKVDRILHASGVDPAGHDGRALRHILDTWPRDDLFQGMPGEILTAAMRVMGLQVRPELALFVRRDPFGRHLSAIVFVPRDRFDTTLRLNLAAMINRATAGELAGYAISMGDGPLARVHFIIAAEPARARALDVAALEAAMTEAARSFRERLREALTMEQGGVNAAATLADWGSAFPDDYAAVTPATIAVQDIETAAAARAAGRFRLALSRPFGVPEHRVVLKLFRADEPVPLSDIVPLIETLGLRVIEEVPYRLVARGGVVMLQRLTLETADGAPFNLAGRGGAVLDAIEAESDQRCEIDGFNRLILRSGLDWRETWLLRALFKWCRQVRAPFSQGAVESALAAHPAAARLLITLFHTRFDPDRPRDSAAEAELAARWVRLLDDVTNPDEDRILRRLYLLLDSVLRTNFYDRTSPLIALKIDSAKAGDMPLPRPMVEIWVHGARMEGCHLRGGMIARGGIRWSDRRDDFRTEILGLMKAQMVKNVVIVPVGAKGGFVLKCPPPPTGDANADREAFMAEGIACYRLLINAMLDITDNLKGGEVEPPARIMRRDGDDPYLVVAADKGTATFSDIANEIAVARGFWLGDAFASGGSVGYDHKAMGITARGAWVNIARHFDELGHDIQSQDFTCAGVGDMSGDVFGNGLLVSHHTKLLAAFDHRHVFIDPDPDPAASFEERRRLFGLKRSSWADYDPARISAGGGVYPRQAKTIPLTPQVASMLGLEPEPQEPDRVLRAILTMRVDLLYFGGIGTYVKAATETQADAGDRANDAIRVDGRQIGARVIGEGANLAVTQAGRIEAAQAGVLINTDALDNSAGVSTSDHEVNIKILLAGAIESGGLTAHQRVDLLGSMTDEVAALVLCDNHQQSQAISLDALGGAADLPAQNALMTRLEAARILDRAVAGLPDASTMAARAAAGQALTRPEHCTLMAHAKLYLGAAIDVSPLVDDPALDAALVEYFPATLQSRFRADIERHRLKRELIGTAITNELINRMGAAAFGRIGAESGQDAPAIALAALIARAAFDLPERCRTIEDLGMAVPAALRLGMLQAVRRLQEATARILLAGPSLGAIGAEVAALRPGLAALTEAAYDRLRRTDEVRIMTEQGIPPELACFTQALPDLLVAPIVVRLANRHQCKIKTVRTAWIGTGESFAIDALRSSLAAVPNTGGWAARATASLADELNELQSHLVEATLTRGCVPADLRITIGRPAETAVALAHEVALLPDLAAMIVAVRALRGVTA